MTMAIAAGKYVVRFAESASDLDRVLRLRYQVFNVELGEGLGGSAATGRDEDRWDARFHHLLVEDGAGRVVGTYRMQDRAMARSQGYYSASLFTVDRLPLSVLDHAVEIGRACVAKEHRNGRVLHLLWRGLARYLERAGAHVLFGCCSLTSQDEAEGRATHEYLRSAGALHSVLRVHPRAGRECIAAAATIPTVRRVPALFQAYLDLGAKVLGPPAIDREFRTIDWLVLLDIRELGAAAISRLLR